ncbi:MAG: sarcosine oxidase subunit gamma family protein [Rhizobiaceae bacterium]
MVEPLSPLAAVWQPGQHGNVANGVGVTLSEPQPGSIVQAAAWPGQEKALIAAISTATGLVVPDGASGGVVGNSCSAFGIAPGRFLVVDEKDGLAARLSGAIAETIGTVTDLSHGRTALRITGPKAEWILSKLFAVNLAATKVPLGSAVATSHHEVFAQIQRTGADQFDIYVFRSFARSFWSTLCHAAEETGYEVR